MKITPKPGSISAAELDRVIEKYRLALGDFVKGNPEPMKLLFSIQEDITLANPFGGMRHGRQQVVEGLESSASFFEDGEAPGFQTISKHVTNNLASIIVVENYRTKVVGRQYYAPISLRVTSLLRLEDGLWKVIHRHADPLVTAQPNKFFI